MANGNMGKPSCHHFWRTQTLKLGVSQHDFIP